jgi:hypothetical protein
MFWLYHDGEWVVHTCAKGNAKAAAHAVPSADAVSEWVKRLQK